jgi:hypothetical protein
MANPRCDMDCFVRECVCLFHNKQSKGHLSLFFGIQFFRQRVSFALQCALVFVIDRRLFWREMFVPNLILFLDLTIYMQVTLKGLWVR